VFIYDTVRLIDRIHVTMPSGATINFSILFIQTVRLILTYIPCTQFRHRTSHISTGVVILWDLSAGLCFT